MEDNFFDRVTVFEKGENNPWSRGLTGFILSRLSAAYFYGTFTNYLKLMKTSRYTIYVFLYLSL